MSDKSVADMKSELIELLGKKSTSAGTSKNETKTKRITELIDEIKNDDAIKELYKFVTDPAEGKAMQKEVHETLLGIKENTEIGKKITELATKSSISDEEIESALKPSTPSPSIPTPSIPISSAPTISGNTAETATGIIKDIQDALTQLQEIATNKGITTDTKYTEALAALANTTGGCVPAVSSAAAPTPAAPLYYTPPTNYNDKIIVTNNNIGFLKFPFTGKNPDGPLKQLDLYAMLLLFNMITPNAATELKSHLEAGGKFSIKEASIKWLLEQLPLKVKASGSLATSNAVDTLQMVIDKVKKLLNIDFASVGGEGLLNSKLDISTDLYQISYFIARDRQHIQKSSGSEVTKEEHVKNMNNILVHLEELRKIIRGADNKVRGGKSPKLLRRSRKQKKEDIDSDEDVQVSD
jgi:hypothetical protein